MNKAVLLAIDQGTTGTTWKEAGRFLPTMAAAERERRVSGWRQAVSGH